MRKLGLVCAASALLSLLVLGAALLLPRLSMSGSRARGLSLLRGKAEAIRKEFRLVLAEMEDSKHELSEMARSSPQQGRFQSLKQLRLEEETEGAAYHGREGRLGTWLGNVLDLEQLLRAEGPFRTLAAGDRSLIIKDKASVYLIVPQRLDEGIVFHFRLLSFRAQFRSPYLSDYQFLRPSLVRYGDIDYWDYQEDLAGFERIFARHKDEYLGQYPSTESVSSLIFPLRLRDGRIAATVTLSVPSPGAAGSLLRERLLLVFSLSLLVSGLLLLVLLGRAASRPGRFQPARVALFMAALAVLRLLFLMLGDEGAFRSLSVFSPAQIAVRSLGGLTRSPADLFVTSFFIFLAAAFLTRIGKKLLHGPARPRPVYLSGPVSLAASLLALASLHSYQSVLRSVVDNSNLNLLRFSSSSAFLLIHISLLALALTTGLFVYWLFRVSGRLARGWVTPASGLALAAGIARVLFLPADIVLGLGLPLLTAALILFGALFLRKPAAGRDLFLTAVLTALFLVVSLNIHTGRRDRDLVQGTLKNIVSSQEEWASVFLEESLETIDQYTSLVLEALRQGRDAEEARRLWEKTVIARFNWYSSLEILNTKDETVSRFALNVPRSFRPSPALPPSLDWSVTALSVPFIGREKEFLVGHRDWRDGERPLGRTIFSVSLDYDLLPFLYSANPYFELLRVYSLPSLEQVDLEFVVFDEGGRILFNPGRLTAGPPTRLLPHLLASPDGRWVRWRDRGRTLSVFCFPHGGRLHGLCLPEKSPVSLASEFLKLFFLYGLCLVLPALVLVFMFHRPRLRSSLKSFSNRVYTSFLIMALIPLLLLTLFTRSYFSGVFTRQFTRAAEADAAFTRNVLKDFLYLQREDKSVVIPPPEDLVLWVSAAIGNDVSLYQDGRLVSSSRREFFDSGVLPALMDGELHHRFQSEIRPFLTQRRKIGKFSFNTLTIPFDTSGAPFFISLPFPFEQQEVAGAASGLVDFFLLASVFFALAVAAVARSLGSAIVTPIRKLLTGTREVGLGNLEVSLQHKPDDEMQGLFQGFNAMVRSLKQHQQELMEMSRRAAWAEMARKVAHEVKNPLTPIQLSAEHLLRVYEDGKSDFGQALRQAVSYITTEVENLRKIAQEFLATSRESALRKEPTDLRELLEEILAPYKSILTGRIAVVESYAPGPIVCPVDRSKLQIALRNFLINALESISGRGTIRVRTGSDDGRAFVEVEDTGSGMSPEVLGRIFEPHFSTKPLGTGLGLPIAKKIIEDHGGSLRLASEPGRGTRVTILLPLVST